MSWSDIPMDLLLEIIKLHDEDVVDVIRFESVCTWWRQVSSCREYPRNKPQIPWLMLSPFDNGKGRYFSSLTDRKAYEMRYFYSLTERKIYEFRLPEIAGHYCVGSSQGYLLSVEPDNADLIAINPFVPGARLTLPPTSALPDVVRVIRNSSGRVTQYELSRVRMADMNFSEPYNLEIVYSIQYKKAILSPGADIAVVIHGFKGWLAFARVADQTWTALGVPTLSELDDMIFHKGRLHVIDFMGTLAIFDLNHPSDPPFISPRGPLGMESGPQRRYLVESPCGENLFIVYRGLSYCTTPESPRTDSFKIYVLDKTVYTWNQIKTLGDVSLFLGFNYSMSLCTHKFPRIKRNCIYFTDDNKILYSDEPEQSSDMGVFNLEDASVGPLYADSKLNGLYWPPPMWFMPTLP